ncbi:NADH-flavin reductase [Lysinibacillus sp. BF-4]|uniref:NAD(P)-dependent oxidoreductase n=1 Tax=Lysinibacillus sp. BF-4 TaxID=1473546 RepID=UPI000501B565|nr:NAD(P)-dependent oxidoreductase [Lysinibacillus sp. BF-4]KFL43059.1 NADH-flavin reductase [Lysinibacillus sp. BF-4]
MNIAIIGATGHSGQKILAEAIERGHIVTAIVRDETKLEQDVKVIEKDLFDLTTADIEPFDVVISTFNAPAGKEEMHVSANQHLISIFEDAPQVRLVVVGGAGSLFMDDSKTTRLSETKDFPAAYLPTATNMCKSLEDYKKSSATWTYISPAAMFDLAGERTGHYTLGGDVFHTNAKGESYISYADYAIALMDEVESGKHVGERISVVN